MLRNHTSTLSYTSAPDSSTGSRDFYSNPVAAKRQSTRCSQNDAATLLKEREHGSIRRLVHHLSDQGASLRRIRSRVNAIERGLAHCRRHKTDIFNLAQLGIAKRKAAKQIAADLAGIVDVKGHPHFEVAGCEVRLRHVYMSPRDQQKIHAAMAAAAKRRQVAKQAANAKPSARAARKVWRRQKAASRRELIEQKRQQIRSRISAVSSLRGAHLHQNRCSLGAPPRVQNAKRMERIGQKQVKIDKPSVYLAAPPQPPSIPDHIQNLPSPKGAAATALLADRPTTPQPTPIERGSVVPSPHASSDTSEPQAPVAASDDAFGDGKLHNFSEKKARTASPDWLSPAELEELGPGAKEAWAPFTSRDPATRRRIAARIRTTYGNVPTAPSTPPGAAPTPKDGRPTELTAMQQAESEAWIAKMCGITKQSATANAPSTLDAYKSDHLLVEVAGRDEYLSWRQLDRDKIGSQFVAFAAVQLERKLQKRESVGNRASWLYSRAKMYAHEGVKDAGLIANPYPYESDDFAAATLAPKFNLYEGVGHRRWR